MACIHPIHPPMYPSIHVSFVSAYRLDECGGQGPGGAEIPCASSGWVQREETERIAHSAECASRLKGAEAWLRKWLRTTPALGGESAPVVRVACSGGAA